MDVKQQAINYAALARQQINEQIKLNRELIDQTRDQIKGLIQQQIKEAKEEQLKLAQEAKMSAQDEMNKEAYAHAQLMKSIEMLSEGTGVNQEQVAQEVIQATQAASKIVEQISQVFNPIKPQEVLEEKLEEKPEEKLEEKKSNDDNPEK